MDIQCHEQHSLSYGLKSPNQTKGQVNGIVNLVTEDGHSDLPTGVCVGMFGPMYKTYPQNIFNSASG